jgi:hypothetical protein
MKEQSAQQPLIETIQGGSVLHDAHSCSYQVVVSDLVIVRWCPLCGTTHKLERYSTGGPFPGNWTRIREAL